MACELNQDAWEKVIDEDLAYLLKQTRTLERDHIVDCLKWLRANKPIKERNPNDRPTETETHPA